MNKSKIKEIKAIYARKNHLNKNELVTIDINSSKKIVKSEKSFFNSIINKLNIDNKI